MLDIFNELVAAGRYTEIPLTSVRVKLHVPCQWACYFCHMEGNPQSDSIRDIDELLRLLAVLRGRFGFNEVHLTGGEPSIHPKIKGHVAALKEAGFLVKMTTNGQLPPDVYRALAAAGLSEINLSVHTLDAGQLAALMAPARSLDWGREALAAQRRICEARDIGLRVKVNTCVGSSEHEALKIAEMVRATGVSWRIMKVLDNAESSYAAMKRLCEELGAKPQHATLVRGTSSCSVLMRAEDGFSFTVKLIRPLRLRSMCGDCPIFAAGQCFEFAYGQRIERARGKLQVRSCLYRDSSPQVLSPTDFLESSLADELRGLVFA